MRKEKDSVLDIIATGASVPVPRQSELSFVTLCDCGMGNHQLTYKCDSESVARAYMTQLSEDGYEICSENRVLGSVEGEEKVNLFASYVKAESFVHVSWREAAGLLKVTFGKKDINIIKHVRARESTIAPTLSMIKLRQTGMCLVVQRADGGYIVIDGGTIDEDNQQRLWSFLVEHLPEGESKPRVTWILTHNHNDHVNGPKMLLREHSEQLELELVIFNFPNFRVLPLLREYRKRKRETDVFSEQRIWEILAEHYPDTPIWCPHAGDRTSIAGVDIEVLFTQEDLAHRALNYMNDTSLAFRISAGGYSCMVYADCEKIAGDFIYRNLGAYLKSDVMQLPHHGRGASSWELYSSTDPEICLWPVCGNGESVGDFNDELRLGNKAGLEYNALIRDDSIRKRRHYHHSQTTLIDMSTLKTVGEYTE